MKEYPIDMESYYLRKWQDPVLRRKCDKVDDFSGLDMLLKYLNSIMFQNPGEGLAAPQIGDSRRVLIAMINGKAKIFVNPKITEARGYLPVLESCRSLPGLLLPRLRRYSIDLEYQTETGEVMNETYRGIGSTVLQHEIDHLGGKLVFQYFKKI